jgi:uncharacterized membrane protein YhaH (DUF805 family)
MKANKNLYNYSAPKSGNEETGFFNTKGRINRKAFFLRCLLSLVIYIINKIWISYGIWNLTSCIKVNDDSGIVIYSDTYIFFKTVHYIVLPIFLAIFIFIQGAKRTHDINKSGWYFLIPLYNIYLSLLSGTKGNNDYGIDPTPIKNVQYFDELEHDSDNSEQQDLSLDGKTNLDKWRAHLSQVRKANPNKSYQEVMALARKTYEKPIKTVGGKNNNVNINTAKSKSKKSRIWVYMLLGIISFIAYGLYNDAQYPKNKYQMEGLLLGTYWKLSSVEIEQDDTKTESEKKDAEEKYNSDAILHDEYIVFLNGSSISGNDIYFYYNQSFNRNISKTEYRFDRCKLDLKGGKFIFSPIDSILNNWCYVSDTLTSSIKVNKYNMKIEELTPNKLIIKRELAFYDKNGIEHTSVMSREYQPWYPTDSATQMYKEFSKIKELFVATDEL